METVDRDRFRAALEGCDRSKMLQAIAMLKNTKHNEDAAKRSDPDNQDFLLRRVFDNPDFPHATKMRIIDFIMEE